MNKAINIEDVPFSRSRQKSTMMQKEDIEAFRDTVVRFPHNDYWLMCIIISIVLHLSFVLYNVQFSWGQTTLFVYLFDLLFAFDWFLNLLHVYHPEKINILFTPRPAWKMLIDLISLKPLEMVNYKYELNRLIRVIRIIEYFHERRNRVGPWPVLTKLTELMVVLILSSSFLSCVVFHYSCYYVSEDNCITLLLKYGTVENFTLSKGYLYWYIKTQNLVLIELTNGGFYHERMHNDRDRLLISCFLIIRLIFLLLFIMPLMTTAFCEVRRTSFFLPDFKALLIASLEVNNKTHLLPRFIKFYNSMRISRNVPEEWGDMHPLPIAVQKEINMNAHWGIVRSSGLFKDMDLSARRNVALLVKSWFLPEGETIFKEGSNYSRMLFVLSGTLVLRQQARRQETHLGRGTCLGGVNLFYDCPSAFTVTCLTYCELDYIERDDFEKLTDENEIVREQCHSAMLTRVSLARELSGEGDALKSPEFQHLQPPMAWMEQLYYDKLKGKPPKTLKGMEERFYKDTFIGEYAFVPQQSLTCIQRLLKIGSPFLSAWRRISTTVIVISAFVFPYYACRAYRISIVFLVYALIHSLTYCFDVCVSLFTFTEIDSDLKAPLKKRINILKTDYIFYIDIITIFPICLLSVESATISHPALAIATLIHALKLCKLVRYAKESKVESVDTDIGWRILKLFMVGLYPLWILTVFVYAISCVDDYCMKQSWETNNITILTPILMSSLSLMCSCETGVTFSRKVWGSEAFHLLIIITLIIFCCTYVYLFADITSNLMLRRSNIYEFQVFVQNIRGIMDQRRVEKYLKKRVRSCIEAIGYISNFELQAYRRENLTFIPEILKQDLLTSEIIHILKASPIFRNASDEFVSEIANAMEIHILPPGEMVVNAGQHSAHFFIIQEGLCECLSRSSQKKVIMGKSDIISFIEVMGRFPMLSSVRCLTFCRIMALEFFVLQRILVKYNEVSRDFDETLQSLLNEDTVIKEINAELELIKNEPKVYSNVRDKIFTKSCSPSSWRPKNICLKILSKCLLLNFVILPHGKLIVIMEGIRMVCSVISTVIFSLRRLVFMYSEHVYSYYIYIIFLLDAPAYVDIFMRFHHAYHDHRGILITQPFKIILHYLNRSFIVDLIACLPLSISYGHLINISERISIIEGLLYSNRAIQMYRIYRLPELLHIMNRKYTLFVGLVTFTVITIAVVSTLTGFMLVTSCGIKDEIFFCNKFDYTSEVSSDVVDPLYAYAYLQLWVISVLGNVGCYGMSTLGFGELSICALTLFGYTSRIVVYSTFTSSYFEYNNILIDYQRDTKRMIKFMKDGNFNEKMKSNVMNYYYLHWKQTRNIEFIPLFRTLHPSLNMDVLFSMFATTLRKCQLFFDLGDDAIRIILPIARFEHFSKGGRIRKAHDVSDNLHIVMKGTAVVRGADRQVVSVHEVGSMFGNLGSTQWQRQKITTIATDDVETLHFNTLRFYERLEIFPQFKNLMRLYTQYHSDLIPAVTTARERGLSFEEFTEVWRGQNDNERIQFAQMLRKHFTLGSHFFSPISLGSVILRRIGICLSFLVYVIIFLELFYIKPPLYCTVIVYVCDVLHLFVMYHKFKCAYYDKLGRIVTNPHTIADHYIYSLEFVFDALSVIPADIFFLIFLPRYASLARLNRCFKVHDVYAYINSKRNHYHSNYIFNNLAHIILVVVTVFLPLASLSVFVRPLADRTPFHFADSLYVELHLFALANFRCANMDNLLQILFYYLSIHVCNRLWMFTIVWWCGVSRALLGSLETYARRTRAMNIHLKSRELPKYLMKEAWTYSRFFWDECGGYSEPRQLAKSPRLLRQKLTEIMYGKVIKRHGFYRMHRDFFRQMIEKTEHVLFFPGNVIAIAGIPDYCTYFICWGIVEETAEGQESNVENIRTLKGGEVFGIKQGVFPDTTHRYTYRARTKCSILMLRYYDWCYLMDFFPAVKREMYQSSSSLYIFSND